MEKIRNLVRKIINEISNPYRINWEIPNESYFKQELDELLGNEMRFDKEEFFHPTNYKSVYSMLPKTFRKIAEHSVNREIQKPEEIKRILLNKRIGELMDDWGDFRHVLMNNRESQEEALNFFRKGKLVDWSDDKIETTFYMGKPSKVYQGNDQLGINLTSSKMIDKYKDVEHTGGHIHNLEKFRTAAKEERVENLPAPFVMRLPSGGRDGNQYTLIGGHKRSTVAIQLHVPIKVWLIDLG